MKVELVVEHEDRYYRTEIDCPEDIGYEVLVSMAQNNIQSMYELVQHKVERGKDRPRAIKDNPQA
jgi:hypothetical protein